MRTTDAREGTDWESAQPHLYMRTTEGREDTELTDLLHKELTGDIIGVYYDVYNATSRSYPEYIYERAMEYGLREKHASCRSQVEYQILYKSKLVGAQYLDLLVAEQIIVELKVVSDLDRMHTAQTLSYLKATGLNVGLLCNFGSPVPQFERLYFGRHDRTDVNAPTTPRADWPDNLLSPHLTSEVIGGLYEVHAILGSGFVHRVYANAVYHELLLRGLEVVPCREYQVFYRDRPLGEIKFNHLRVQDDLMVFPVALSDINSLSISSLKAWMQAQGVPLAIVANFSQEALDFMVLRV